LPQLGKLDEQAGEFWVTNPFQLPQAGHNLSAFERNRLFLNDGGRGFIDASRFSNVDIDSDSRSVVVADFDRDGQSDLLVGSVGGGPLRLFLNRFAIPGNRRIRIDLVGTKSNRQAIGTRVVLDCGSVRIVRDLFATNGCMGMSPPELVIGVGKTTQIRNLTVRWPTGELQRFDDVPTNVRIQVTEGDGQLRVSPLPEPNRGQEAVFLKK
jgi:hypothetical protein